MATIETLPLLFIFILITSYSLGFFGVVHTAIKDSIGARAYAFETFRNRTNLVYFRDIDSAYKKQFSQNGVRTHTVLTEGRSASDNGMRVVERPIQIGLTVEPGPSRNDPSIHNVKLFAEPTLEKGKRNQKLETSPVWLMIQYGMCLNLKCGDQS